MTEPAALSRRLGVGDAVAIGLASMLGAGVYGVLGPAASVAGSALLVSLAIAAVIAYCNAVSSAQLAAAYPQAGGTYHYGREVLGPWPGFVAGWGFCLGKTASCSAMALVFAAYAVPGEGWITRLVAASAVVAITALNLRGVTRTAQAAKVLAVVTLTVLALLAAVALVAGSPDGSRLWSGTADVGAYDVLQAAGLMFFAFAGYARMATLAEEVRDPRVTLPRAIPVALGIVVVTYAVISVVSLSVAGPGRLAGHAAPLEQVARAAESPWLVPVLSVGAAASSLGALLALLAGIGRTSLAMAREGDLPRWLNAVHPRTQVPHRTESVAAACVVVLVCLVDLRDALGFSSFGVLLYYAIANVAALRQRREQRIYPRALSVFGLVGCVVLACTLPGSAVLAAALVLVAGVAYRLVVVTR